MQYSTEYRRPTPLVGAITSSSNTYLQKIMRKSTDRISGIMLRAQRNGSNAAERLVTFWIRTVASVVFFFGHFPIRSRRIEFYCSTFSGACSVFTCFSLTGRQLVVVVCSTGNKIGRIFICVIHTRYTDPHERTHTRTTFLFSVRMDSTPLILFYRQLYCVSFFRWGTPMIVTACIRTNGSLPAHFNVQFVCIFIFAPQRAR